MTSTEPAGRPARHRRVRVRSCAPATADGDGRTARRHRCRHEHPRGRRLRHRMRRPLRPQHDGHADRNPRPGVGVRGLVGWRLQRHRIVHRDDELRSDCDREVRAHHPYPERVAGGGGSGSVAGTGISCPGTCSAGYASETLAPRSPRPRRDRPSAAGRVAAAPAPDPAP